MILGVRISGFKIIFLGLLLAGLLGAASVSFAQSSEPESMRPPVLKKFETDGGKVEFLGHVYGLDGWVITKEKDDKKQVETVYTTPDGALILGVLFSPDGILETQKQLEAYKQRISGSQAAADGAENSSSKSEKFYAQTEKSSWVALGDSTAPYLYIFINVNCGHCQAFWKDLENFVKQGKLQVRLVPFGQMQENRDAGAALLSVENPEEAWRAYVGGDTTALSKDKIKADAYSKLDANTTLARDGKLPMPPFTLYRRPGDGILTAIAGRSGNIMLLMAEFLK